MIDTSLTFTANGHASNQPLSSSHSDNFAQMLTNHSSPAKEQSVTDNADSAIEQQGNTLSALNDFFTDETSSQIDQATAQSDNPQFSPLTANQFIDQLPIQLAEVATQLRLENDRTTLDDQTTEQAIIEQLANNSDNSDEKLRLKSHTQLAISTSHSATIEYPLAKLAAPFNEQPTSQSLPLIAPMQSNINAATLTNTVENPELISLSPTNNNPIPLTSLSANPAALTQAMTASINSIALTTPIDQPEWGQKFSEQIVMLSRHGAQQAELRLHPEELGSLQIQLKIFDDKAQLSVVTANQQVRQIIESNLTQLRHALSEQGIQLGQTHVGEQHNEQNSAQDNQPATPLSSITNETNEQESDSSLTKIQQTKQVQITSGIDVFA
ncbi:flagellar hook-length control protein FliK [Arsenophonus apicola]|uniref:Flagellar hook-length control protein FliK n=1 Tax=Arsenophonus apicola TaxID=2879119 RepID=A0ABY8NZJ0_9GAMM|nr:flagellar hook-length control protein FliK [Arsenophonus apicola]WGO82653.1 flagellar hook-length control protein FliK [Arsenophonus apicola]